MTTKTYQITKVLKVLFEGINYNFLGTTVVSILKSETTNPECKIIYTYCIANKDKEEFHEIQISPESVPTYIKELKKIIKKNLKNKPR
jgi:hypothetical protein